MLEPVSNQQTSATADEQPHAVSVGDHVTHVPPTRSDTSSSTGYLRHSDSGRSSRRGGRGAPSPTSPRYSAHSSRSQRSDGSVHSIGHAERTAFAAKLRGNTAKATSFKHQRDAILHDPSFQWKTFYATDEYYFDDPYRSLEQADTVNTIECWDYEDTDDVDRNEYVRFLEAGDVRHFGPDDNDDPARFNERFERWLKQEGDFKSLRPAAAGKLNGGLRLALCDRPLMDLGMTIRRDVFESIEKTFDLHESSLPAFEDKGGCFSIFKQRGTDGTLHRLHIVVKVVQKVEIGNSLLSLTYNVPKQWTDAFACGDSLVLGSSRVDEIYGSQQTQLLDAIACGSKQMWTNPLAIPVALLQKCAKRALTRAGVLEQRLIAVEGALGVVNAGWVLIKEDRPNWPLDIDVKRQTRDLHSALPKILFMKSVAQWQGRYAAWLLETAKHLRTESAFAHQDAVFEDIISTVSFHASSIDGLLQFLEGMEGRTQSQINMLFNVIGQIDAIHSKKANDLNLEVARSTKEDSISMSTFTFITAIFLPGSFIATMFSMGGMFEWAANTSDDESGGRVVSKRYWVFWAVAAPLTVITLAGWYAWYQHASHKWHRKLAEGNTGVAQDSGSDDDGHGTGSQIHVDESPVERKKRMVIEEYQQRQRREAKAQASQRGKFASWLPKGLIRFGGPPRNKKSEKTSAV